MLEKLLGDLSNHIKEIDISKQDVPVGISITCGGRFMLNYSLSFGESFDNLEMLSERLKIFLKTRK